MGRLVGRRPDPTPRIAKAMRRLLAPDEQVLAGLYVQRPGTQEAALQGGTSAAVATAVGDAPPSFASDPKSEGWPAAAARVGIDPERAARTIKACLVLTDARLLLARRSSLTGRVKELVAAWPLDDPIEIRAPRAHEQHVTLLRDGQPLRLELPLAVKFLPDTYRSLPALLAQARADSTDS